MRLPCMGVRPPDVLVVLGWVLLAWATFLSQLNESQARQLVQMQYRYRNLRDLDCKLNCTKSRPRPLCGTDGRTYPHKCEIKRLRKCEGKKIRIQHKGSCRVASSLARGGSKCLEERNQAREQARKPAAGVYIPECRVDGTYAEVQCHAATGYCWCVTDDGKPIPGSSLKAKKINCRGCSPTDRSTFNTNLIRLFSEEFNRIPKPTRTSESPKGLPLESASDALLDTPEKRVIEWKFSELDLNKDNKLRRKEMRALKRMVKKVVKPKACARSFESHCDLDHDGHIARGEWSVCLGVDITKEQHTTLAPSTGGLLGGGGGAGGGGGGGIPLHTSDTLPASLLRSSADAVEDEKDKPHNPSGPTLWNKQKPIRPHPSIALSPSSDAAQPPATESPPSRRNCEEEKAVAEDMDRSDPEGRIYIPVCAGGGKYRKEQCHTSTGYCWCVDENTGKPIPGTSTHGIMPNCSKARVREFKGCPYSKKKKFLQELLDHMTKEMMDWIAETAKNASTKNRDIPEPNPDHSLEERVVRWKLHILDRNRNEILERREWKAFRKHLQKTKTFKKCGRNFIKYCDEDKDNKVTTEEWIDCMGLNEDLLSLAEPQRGNLPANPRRVGPNPFSKYLRS